MTDATGLTIPADYQARTDALAGRTIVVTGAAAGIGRATARAAARAGASVVLLDKQVRKLESLYDEIEQDGSPEAAIYPMDLLGATPDDHTEMAQRLRESYGSLYAIVHNAADLGQPAPLEHYDPQAWLRTIHINLNA
ncbi:MAG: SDR family NAD(P)-dependent oxidoreductase, partial [Ectothiorhodospiraceae bacterium]